MLKTCCSCGVAKTPSAEFFVTLHGRLRGLCKDCGNKRTREYYAKNKEQLLANNRKYREENKNRIKEKQKEWNERNKDKLREYKRNRQRELRADIEYREKELARQRERRKQRYAANETYREEQKEAARQYRKRNKKEISERRRKHRKEDAEEINRKRAEWYAANKGTIKARRKKDYEANKDKYAEQRKNNITDRLARSVRQLIYIALKDIKKSQPTFQMLGYTKEELKQHLERQFIDDMSWDNYGRHGWHIDHIQPVSSFEFTGPDCEAIKQCWALSNLRPLWAKDNLSKGAKVETLI